MQNIFGVFHIAQFFFGGGGGGGVVQFYAKTKCGSSPNSPTNVKWLLLNCSWCCTMLDTISEDHGLVRRLAGSHTQGTVWAERHH